MSETFLTRWSRRKRQAAQPVDAPDQRNAEAPQVGAADSATPALSETSERGNEGERQSTPTLVDPASLPPIETIEAGTDIRQFLGKGVPAELRDAALRRAWVTDPAIRDFVGLAENAYDFNAPDGVPGFSPLQAGEEIARMVSQIVGPATPLPDIEAAAKPKLDVQAVSSDPVNPEPGQSDPAPHPDISQGGIANARVETPGQDGDNNPVPLAGGDVEISVKNAELHGDDASTHHVTRTHGRALPQ